MIQPRFGEVWLIEGGRLDSGVYVTEPSAFVGPLMRFGFPTLERELLEPAGPARPIRKIGEVPAGVSTVMTRIMPWCVDCDVELVSPASHAHHRVEEVDVGNQPLLEALLAIEAPHTVERDRQRVVETVKAAISRKHRNESMAREFTLTGREQAAVKVLLDLLPAFHVSGQTIAKAFPETFREWGVEVDSGERVWTAKTCTEPLVEVAL